MGDESAEDVEGAKDGPIEFGAVALIDALGFQGIWRRGPSKHFVDRLHQIKDAIDTEALLLNTMFVGATKALFFSDSILLVASADRDDPISHAHALELVCGLVHSVVQSSLEQSPSFLYRGCVALGECFADGPFVVGPAIDEAAKWYQAANAAVVWMLPSAEARAPIRDLTIGHMRWDVPIKTQGLLSTTVVNPVARAWGRGREPRPPRLARIAETRDRMLQLFDAAQVDVLIKRQETERLLNEGVRICETKGRP